MIEFEDGTFQIGAEVIADGLCLTPEMVMQGLRDGTITSICEKGLDEDDGRHRLTFFSSARRLRLIVDATGAIVKQSSVDHVRRASDVMSTRGERQPQEVPVRPEPR